MPSQPDDRVSTRAQRAPRVRGGGRGRGPCLSGLSVLALASVPLVACEEKPTDPGPPTTTVTVTNAPLFLSEGDSVRLEATVRRPDGTVDSAAVVTWSSNQPTLARIDAGGKLVVLAAVSIDGSIDETLLDTATAIVAARSGTATTTRTIALRGWRFTRAAPGRGFLSPFAIRESENRFSSSSGSGIPLRLRVLCQSALLGGGLVISLDASVPLIVPGNVSVDIDDGDGGTFARWSTPSTEAVPSVSLNAADAVAFANALAAGADVTADFTLGSNPPRAATASFRVNGFARFWNGAGALLGGCR